VVTSISQFQSLARDANVPDFSFFENVTLISPLGATDRGHWTPGIGDPTWVGWLTVIAYWITAGLCYRKASWLRRRWGTTRLSAFWFALAFILLFLGLNKQLDLQTAITEIGKYVAREQGWYARRRELQKLFIFGLGIAGASAWLSSYWLLRDIWRRIWLAAAGLAFLSTFIAIRAVSFHDIDQFLGWQWSGIYANWMLELGGIGCVGIAASNQK